MLPPVSAGHRGCAARQVHLQPAVVHVCWVQLGWVDGAVRAIFQNSLLHTGSTRTVHKRAPLCFPKSLLQREPLEKLKSSKGGRMPDFPESTKHSLWFLHISLKVPAPIILFLVTTRHKTARRKLPTDS